MFYILFFGCVSIFILYRKNINLNFTGFSSFVKSNKILVYLLSTLFFPVLLVSFFYGQKTFNSPEEKIYIGEKYKNYTLQLEGLNEITSYSDTSAAVHINYVHDIFQVRDDNLFKCIDLSVHYRKSDLKSHRLTLEYLQFYCNNTLVDIDYLNSLDSSNHAVNLLKGIYFLQKDKSEISEQYFLNEVILNPSFKPTYRFLFDYYEKNDHARLKELMTNSDFTDYLNYDLKDKYYYKEGMLLNYLLLHFEERVLKSPWIVIIAAFLISFSWMFFLRTLDIFNRERWQDIVIVFILGAIGTLFCLPLYEFAGNLGFGINGNALNDFLYCTFVIGGAEEIVKLLPWLIFCIVSRRLKEPFDYILYACVSALGFAFLENLMYLERYNNVTGRAIMAGVGHMFDASIVAYFIVLAKYRYQNLSSKVLAVFVGFLLAMLAHGFYDFWLISPAVSHLAVITPIFFLLSLHIWFYFINNTMNISPYFKGSQYLNIKYKQDILTISIFTLLILEYVITSVEIGSQSAGPRFLNGALLTALFITFMHFRLQNIHLLQGKWFQYSFSKVIPRFNLSQLQLFSLPSGNHSVNEKKSNTQESHIDFSGESFRLFAPKTNRFVGSYLPTTGSCIRKIEVAGNPNWYLFKLDTPINFPNMLKDYIILKNKNDNQTLAIDKIEIYFMLIPEERFLQKDSLEIASLRYVGKTYSRPIK